MILQHILIIYIHNLRISCHKSLKYDICKFNIMKRFVKKRNDLTLNMIISRRCTRIILILNNFCDCCIDCQIHFRNRRINRSMIKIKIKHRCANEIIYLIELIIRDNRTRKLCKQIYLCVFKKTITTINEVEKIIAIIIIKLLKH